MHISSCYRELGCWGFVGGQGRSPELPTGWVSPAARGTAQCPLASCSPAATSSLHYQHTAGTLLGHPVHRTRLAKAIYDSLYLTNWS